MSKSPLIERMKQQRPSSEFCIICLERIPAPVRKRILCGDPICNHAYHTISRREGDGMSNHRLNILDSERWHE